MKKLRIAGYNIENISFSSGQEPDGLDEEFATTFDVDFSISGGELSKMLGIQERVLDKKMKKLTGFSNIADKIGWTTFFHEKDGKFVTVLNDNREDFNILKKEGFKEISPQEARGVGKFKEEN